MILFIIKPAGKSPSDAISEYFDFPNAEHEHAEAEPGILLLEKAIKILPAIRQVLDGRRGGGE